MNSDRHHDSAICHIATMLLTRIAACWRAGERYALRDTDGRIVTAAEGRSSVREHHQVDPKMREKVARKRPSKQLQVRAGREHQESPSAPTSRPADFESTRVDVA